MASRTFALMALAVLGGCDLGIFAPREHEVVRCWPQCGALDAPDSGADVLDEDREQDDPIPTDEHPLGDLHALHATPHAITWGWDPEHISFDTTAYRLAFGQSANVLGSVFDADDDPNLAFFESPHLGGRVERTTLTGLAPSTLYFVELQAILADESAVVVAAGAGETTAPAGDEVLVFGDDVPEGATLEGFGPPTSAPNRRSGHGALWLMAHDGEHGPVGISNLSVLVPAELSEDRFARAYFEYFVLAMQEDRPVAVPFLETTLMFGERASYLYSYTALGAQADWQRVQIPLRAFALEAEIPLSPSHLGEVLRGFSISGEWPAGALIVVDDVRLYL